MAKYEMKCLPCNAVREVEEKIGASPSVSCTVCGAPLVRYFGKSTGERINWGCRSEGYYKTPEDYDIARYQFEHLK